MAASKSNRSVHKKQLTHPNQKSAKHTKSSWLRKVFRFPQTKSKIIESVEFSTELGYHSISVNFSDKTSLNFAIDASFTVETDYSNWKTGNQRVLRRWRPVQNLEFRDTV